MSIFNLSGRGKEKEKIVRTGGGGGGRLLKEGNYFNYFGQRGAII